VVVSHPYDSQSRPANAYQVLELTASGALASTGRRFDLGRATGGEIAFTPDGEVGIVAQDDGTLGVFGFEASGAPRVIHARFSGSFYASGVVVDPGGGLAYVIDGNWRENGGGLYRVVIRCDGTLAAEGLWVAAKLPAGFVPLAGGLAVLAARDVLDSPAGDDVHLLRLGPSPALLGGKDAFGDDEAIVSASVVTADGRFVLLADNNEFSGIPNRIAAVALGQTGLGAVQVLPSVEDPVAIVPSPYANAALVVSGYGDALLALDYDPSATTPFAMRGPLVYRGARPQLPGAAVLVGRGALRGRVLVAENLGVRQVQFGEGGGITDLGLTSLGAGSAAITGALGVQP
jgi:hypothetical protein